ncbi:hypothetical protein RhiJN_02143 [Ceratobasidium sp. AG-Ba]|nr:hypothetical protein RhiJN_02143 [Ceratobasidium sp. AG-Ba]QRW03075.1 hypothetical protein RhiLY_02074 [Ceratobasidium sp. AG-Ba]
MSGPTINLPMETVFTILEHSMISETWNSRASSLNQVLLISRATYDHLVKLAYSTVVLSSIHATCLFCDTLELSPRLANYAQNIWIATAQLQPFDSSEYPFRFVDTKVTNVLRAARNLRRVALPYAYLHLVAGLPGVTYLSTDSDIIPPIAPFLPSLEAVHIYGLPSHHCVNAILSRFSNVRQVFMNIPPASGADAAVSVICARTIMSLQQRLNNLTRLEMIVNQPVGEMMKTGMKKTLGENPKIVIREKIWEPYEELLYNQWLKLMVMIIGERQFVCTSILGAVLYSIIDIYFTTMLE